MKAFFGTTLGKVLIGVLAAAVVAGGGYAVYRAVQSDPAPVPYVADEDITIEEAIITGLETTAEEDITEAPMTIIMTGVNTNEKVIELFTATPEVIFEWNDNGYWEYKSGTCLIPEWTGNITAVYWTVPEGYEFRTSIDWSDPTVASYDVTGILDQFAIGPGDRIYKID